MPIILHKSYTIPKNLIDEAHNYAVLSRSYTSDKNDFHPGGLDNKQQKMFEGKLGEKVFKMFLIENNIKFTEDPTRYDEKDNYDFLLENNCTVDVKTRTKPFHTRTLEMVKQFNNNPKDIYVSVYLDISTYTGTFIGWTTKERIAEINRIGTVDSFV